MDRADPALSGETGARFAFLDTLRAAAAVLVLLLHAASGLHGGLFSHAYLAVDFFFMLSGFVLSHAYDRRFADGMTVIDFMRRRLRRLWPTMAAGILLGAVATWGRGAPLDLLLPVLLSELLFVPVGRGATDLFVLDFVQWSLMLELLANLVHALCFRWFGTRMLTAIVAGSMIALVPLAAIYGGLWTGYNGDTMFGGVVRIAASYGAGMLIYRLWSRDGAPRARVSCGYAFIGLIAALLVPGLAPPQWWWVDPLIVIVAFPLILWLGATARVLPRWRSAAEFAGATSYPLYVFHVPFLALGAVLVPSTGGAVPIVRTASAIIALGFACLWACTDFRLTPPRASRLNMGTGYRRHMPE